MGVYRISLIGFGGNWLDGGQKKPAGRCGLCGCLVCGLSNVFEVVVQCLVSFFEFQFVFYDQFGLGCGELFDSGDLRFCEAGMGGRFAPVLPGGHFDG